MKGAFQMYSLEGIWTSWSSRKLRGDTRFDEEILADLPDLQIVEVDGFFHLQKSEAFDYRWPPAENPGCDEQRDAVHHLLAQCRGCQMRATFQHDAIPSALAEFVKQRRERDLITNGFHREDFRVRR